ncbi:MAG: TIGR01212 family radical SAM protein [Brevinematales bacterium]|nr:TIGR01212 family radical SAM protein [Brevinematales bacterium]
MKWGKRPYYALKVYLEKRFGFPVKRIALDAGFTCPNRDGKLSRGGCVYCGEEGARASYVQPELSPREQLLSRMRFWEKRGFRGGYIAYFQAYTNTYGEQQRLRALYDSVLVPGVVGVFIGTRPDCLDDGVLEVLTYLAQKTWVTVEVGVQSTHDPTLALLHRGHKASDSREALRRLREAHVERLVHVIGGLPGETQEIFLKTIADVQEWGCEAIKFHHLFVERNTLLEKWYHEEKIVLLSREEYIMWLVEALVRLDPEIVIHRLFGDCEKDRLVAPLWTLEKAKNVALVEQFMGFRDLWQGKYR